MDANSINTSNTTAIEDFKTLSTAINRDKFADIEYFFEKTEPSRITQAVNYIDTKGNNLLHFAFRCLSKDVMHTLKIIELSLKHMNAKVIEQQNEYEVVVFHEILKVSRIYGTNRPDRDKLIERYEKLIKLFIDKVGRSGITYVSSNGDTAFHVAACERRTNILIQMLENKEITEPDIVQKNKTGNTALHELFKGKKLKNQRVVTLFLDKINHSNLSLADGNGNTVLHKAISTGDVFSTNTILKYFDADQCGLVNNQKQTPLHLAVCNKLKTAVQVLITKMSEDSIALKDQSGKTALELALESCSHEFVRNMQKCIEAKKDMQKCIEAKKEVIKKTVVDLCHAIEEGADKKEVYNIIRNLSEPSIDGDTLLHLLYKYQWEYKNNCKLIFKNVLKNTLSNDHFVLAYKYQKPCMQELMHKMCPEIHSPSIWFLKAGLKLKISYTSIVEKLLPKINMESISPDLFILICRTYSNTDEEELQCRNALIEAFIDLPFDKIIEEETIQQAREAGCDDIIIQKLTNTNSN